MGLAAHSAFISSALSQWGKLACAQWDALFPCLSQCITVNHVFVFFQSNVVIRSHLTNETQSAVCMQNALSDDGWVKSNFSAHPTLLPFGPVSLSSPLMFTEWRCDKIFSRSRFCFGKCWLKGIFLPVSSEWLCCCLMAYTWRDDPLRHHCPHPPMPQTIVWQTFPVSNILL